MPAIYVPPLDMQLSLFTAVSHKLKLLTKKGHVVGGSIWETPKTIACIILGRTRENFLDCRNSLINVHALAIRSE